MNKSTIILVALTFSLNVGAQNTTSTDFQQFRENMLKGYDSFRQNIMDDYDKYLEGVWKEYEKFTGHKRDKTPKPKITPVFKPEDKPTEPVVVEPVVKQPTKPKVPTTPTVPATPPTPKVPTVPQVPSVPETPSVPSAPVLQPKLVAVNFYGNTLQMPAMETSFTLPQLQGRDDIAKCWKVLKNSCLKDMTSSIQNKLSTFGLSDWGNAMLMEGYAKALFPQADSDQQTIVTQFLLTCLGYDVRLAMSDNQITMLIPFKEKVFEMSYMKMNGESYYVYPDVKGSLYSCDVPSGDAGKKMGTLFNGKVNIGSQYKNFTLSGAGITVTGRVNTAYMPMLDKYVEVDIPSVARCVIDKNLRDDIVEQVKKQVAGLSELQAANKMLQFVQYAFDYATDEQQFGREKYFFMEENLYYPKNDCEDRAIFFAYLVRNILHLPVHLIHYPGHECTAVAYSQPLTNATGYTYNGKAYYISDPTYIGADIGMCMPDFRNVRPEVEIW